MKPEALKKKLIFVYNADSDIWSKCIDNLHKIISPNTYSCDLCSLTHGVFSEKKLWKEFRYKSTLDFVFMYKNQFLKEYEEIETGFDFPVILKAKEKSVEVFVSANELAVLNSERDLIDLIEKKIDYDFCN